ncbi:MAG: hypothetical protein R3236_11645, partial [Phycisphaeraceae bacterium]|nr:hypothetical protein [Phycisphaeraceae bacterium]
MKRFYRFLGRVWVICLVGCAAEPKADENNLKATGPFESRWAQQHDQVWLGADYWANPMEDWRILDGRIETVRPAVNRNVHLLSRRLGDRDGDLELSVRLGAFKPGAGSGGFRIGIQSELADPRSRLIHGRGGIDAGIGADGDLFIGRTVGPKLKPGPEGVRLRLRGEPAADGYLLMLTAHDREGRQLGGVFVDKVAPEKLVGNVALVNNFLKANVPGRKNNRAGKPRGRPGRFWFSHWRVSGSKFTAHPEDRFGPILFAQHTLSRGVLKMTAQMPPLDNQQPQRVALELKRDGRWAEAAQATIDPLARTARFRLEAWNGRISVPYRLVYESVNRLGERKRHTYGGTIRREPTDRDLKLAAFTGNTDQAFPNALLVSNVKVHDPDVLLFTGDQLYEQVGGYGIIREPVDRATLNYLRKWYVCGWAFRDLMRDRPTLFLTDDHDVYQGNIWGESGRDCGGIRGHARGGYAMPPKWVNMVQRTQTAHHPDPHDPTPIKRDIGVYYGDMLYGRVSFAILEDRKFKSG